VVMAAYSLGMLALASGVSWVTRAVSSRRHAGQILVGVVALMFVVSVGLLFLPPGPYRDHNRRPPTRADRSGRPQRSKGSVRRVRRLS
jgi:hypothetical protein